MSSPWQSRRTAQPAEAGSWQTGKQQRGSATATETTTPDAPSPAAANGTLEVHFINVGQSVATLLVSPDNETMLIDSGDFTDDGEYVLQYLDRQGIDRIDHFVVSHNDADHIGGNAAVIRHSRPRKAASVRCTTPVSPRARRPTSGTSTPSKPTT